MIHEFDTREEAEMFAAEQRRKGYSVTVRPTGSRLPVQRKARRKTTETVGAAPTIHLHLPDHLTLDQPAPTIINHIVVPKQGAPSVYNEIVLPEQLPPTVINENVVHVPRQERQLAPVITNHVIVPKQAPPVVNVGDVTVQVPKRKVIKEVERDAEGRLTRITEEEQ